MSIIHYFNKSISRFNDKHWKKKIHKRIHPEILQVFKNMGEGLYICNLRAIQSSFISRLIGKISCYREKKKKAPISHSVIIYHGDITKVINDNLHYISILQKKLKKFYKNPPLLGDIQCFVLCGADENGMNYFDFSFYGSRDFSIRPIFVQNEKSMQSIVKDLIDQYKRPYDISSLLSWPFYKIFKFLRFMDDSRSWFCSEVCYEILKRHGIKIAFCNNPSPANIEELSSYYELKYRTSGFLR
jgi:hypothetical protein